MGPRPGERGSSDGVVGGFEVVRAYTGARPGERGSSQPLSLDFLSFGMLQWGRAQVSAEVFRPDRLGIGSGELQWGRAQVSAEVPYEMLLTLTLWLLQWGRAQVSAEVRTSR